MTLLAPSNQTRKEAIALTLKPTQAWLRGEKTDVDPHDSPRHDRLCKTELAKYYNTPALSSLLLLGLLQATHIQVLSAGKCYEGAA